MILHDPTNTSTTNRGSKAFAVKHSNILAGFLPFAFWEVPTTIVIFRKSAGVFLGNRSARSHGRDPDEGFFVYCTHSLTVG